VRLVHPDECGDCDDEKQNCRKDLGDLAAHRTFVRFFGMKKSHTKKGGRVVDASIACRAAAAQHWRLCGTQGTLCV
jgi:hypothetical protein